jgi:uncharacterized protein
LIKVIVSPFSLCYSNENADIGEIRMIRKLTEKDREAVFELIQEKPAENLFIIGDLEAFGFEEDFQEIWGDFTGNGNLRAVLLRYNINFIPYAAGDFDVEGFAEIINHHPKVTQLSGLEELTAALIPHLSRKPMSHRSFYYAKCENDAMLPKDIDLTQVQKATIKDIPRIIKLREQIPEFSGTPHNLDSMKRSMEKGIARSFFVEEDGQVVSGASTTAENTFAGMVVAVCTLKAYKKKGYATKCLTKLSQELLQEDKALCLFYDNPEAGKIYKRLGFVDIGKWTWIKL